MQITKDKTRNITLTTTTIDEARKLWKIYKEDKKEYETFMDFYIEELMEKKLPRFLKAIRKTVDIMNQETAKIDYQKKATK